MLKKELTYLDYNEPPQEIKTTCYFNLTRSELTTMELSVHGGMQQRIEKITKEKDGVKLMDLFRSIILDSYGEKSLDGKRFIKSKEISEAFSQTPAYDIIFMELVTDSKAAIEFIQSILPKDNPPPVPS